MSPVRSLFLRVQGGLFHLLNHQPETIGGQAVVEGVMMRSPTRLSVAVRAPDGRIALQDRPFVSFSKRHKILGLPVLRGGASLVESLYLGMQCLNWSVKIQEAGSVKEEKEEVPTTAMQKAKTVLPLFLSFAAALALFQLLPYGVAAFVTGGSHSHPQNPVLFNFVAGGLVALSFFHAVRSFMPMTQESVWRLVGASGLLLTFWYVRAFPLAVQDRLIEQRKAGNRAEYQGIATGDSFRAMGETGAALAKHGGGQLISFDQHAGFVDATREWLSEHGINADLRAAPLVAAPGDWPGVATAVMPGMIWASVS